MKINVIISSMLAVGLLQAAAGFAATQTGDFRTQAGQPDNIPPQAMQLNGLMLAGDHMKGVSDARRGERALSSGPDASSGERTPSRGSVGKGGTAASARKYPAPDGKGDYCTVPWTTNSAGSPYCPGDIVY